MKTTLAIATAIRFGLIGSLAVTALTACGGGGDDPPPAPTATLSASAATLTGGATATLTWSSTNATSCTASGGWSGSRPTSGSTSVGPLTQTTTFTLTCGGAVANTTITIPTITVSGQITVADGIRTDSDTNDIMLTPVRNDTAATAQSLPNPVMLGGYVNVAGAGDTGPLQQSGDLADYYRVNLLRGQIIEVTVSNPTPAVNDVDLELYNSAQVLVNGSYGVGATERLTLTGASGQYFLRVEVFAGASNYILSVGQTGTLSAPAGVTLTDDFVPGDLLVKTRQTAREVTSGASEKPAMLAAAHGLTIEPSGPGMHSLMKVTPATSQTLVAEDRALAEELASIVFESAELREKWLTVQALKSVLAAPDVEWAEPNWIMTAHLVPNDPLYRNQRWHYEQINLPSAWNITTGSSNVIAAVLDTGVRGHSELLPKFASPRDFVSGAGSGDGDGDDSNASDPGVPVQGGYNFHGTHVAGTIAAVSNDGQGVAGVAWGVRLMPIRVLGVNGSGSMEDIIQGMLYAGGLTNRSGFVPPQRADVINMSLGARGACSAAYQDAVNRVRAAGVIVVASAGNDNLSGDYQPAGCAGVVSVSALGSDRTRAYYSNFGTGVDVAAPGGDARFDRDGNGEGDEIYSTHSTFDGATYYGTHSFMQGTSMAAPHVTGVVALMKSRNAALTPAQFDNLLASGALTDDIGPAGPDTLGVGLINAFKAVSAATAAPPPPAAPQLGVLPTSLNFGEVVTSNEVTVSNLGGGALTVTSTATSAAWLTVTPVQVTGTLGTYRIQINRAGLALGVHNGWVEFRGSAGTAVRVSIIMQVSASPSTSDAGQHYVLLIDPTTGDSRYQVEVQARGPSVSFNFTGVASGTYELAAGTDLNNDGFICDDGEACAEYPIYGEATPITMSGNQTGLTLLTGYRRNSVATSLSSDSSPPNTAGFQRVR